MTTVEIPLRLHPMQRKILLLIEARRDAGQSPPTISEMVAGLGGTYFWMLRHVDSLRSAGMVSKTSPGHRTLAITEKGEACLFILSAARIPVLGAIR